MRETELRDQQTSGLDLLATEELIAALVSRHHDIPRIVSAAAPALARAVDAAAARLAAAGRLTYIASGTPGWLASADAAELPPTFGWPRGRLAVVRARPVSASPQDPDEDSAPRGAEQIDAERVCAGDVVVAIAASGSTPFTTGAAARAASRGALTIAVVAVPDSPLVAACDMSIQLRTGAEPLMGSTRMRAGLAQRLALTVFSTALMVRLGRTYDNLMVEVAPALAKLRERRVAIVAEACGCSPDQAAALLDAAGGDLKVAIVMELAGAGRDRAREALEFHGGRSRAAIEDARSDGR